MTLSVSRTIGKSSGDSSFVVPDRICFLSPRHQDRQEEDLTYLDNNIYIKKMLTCSPLTMLLSPTVAEFGGRGVVAFSPEAGEHLIHHLVYGRREFLT